MTTTSDQKKSVTLDRLVLDKENPRLPASLPRKDADIIRYISNTTSIEDLMSAIASNGFFPGEPLIVIPDEKINGDYIVVEGNRRLTALKLLQDPFIIEKPSHKILEIHTEAKHKPEEVPVIICKDRKSILPYLGFRHITGIKQWEPLAKARYIKQIFDNTSTDLAPDVRYKEVADIIGSRRDHIKRNLDALAVYKVVEEYDFYDIPGLNEQSIKFSVLSTALADDNIAVYCGVRSDDSEPNNPIIQDSIKRDNTQRIVEWLFRKDENGESVVGESRNIRQLSKAVANPKALKALVGGSSLDYAYRQTTGVNDDFDSIMYQLVSLSSEAARIIAHVEYSGERIELARDIKEQIVSIGRSLRNKQEEAGRNDDF